MAHTDGAVKDAAIHCAAAIEARLAEIVNVNTLLRASQPSIGAETLLRPAVAKRAEAQEQLLRMAEVDEAQDR